MRNLKNNRIPNHVEKIYLISICGTGMGALACMLKDLGFQVSGSDQKIYPPMSTFLVEKGIRIHSGFNKKHISNGPDLIIVGNAVTKDNPEVVQMQKMGLCYCSMPQAVNRFMLSRKKPILVTGTHGKTTTSSILAWMLYRAGMEPSFMIGGMLQNFISNYRIGNGDYVVIEGDEYDTAFFDKQPKFLHYDPHLAILSGVEFDHADIFNDIEHVKQAFGRFVLGMPSKGLLLVHGGDENASKLTEHLNCRVEKYGVTRNVIWRLGDVTIDPPWTRFEVSKHGKPFGIFKSRLMGEHNLLNALACIAIADHLMVPCKAMADALETFQGIKRRQEVRGRKGGITVMDDFAHHPTAVRETIQGVKPFYPKGRVIAVFEPRTNSSRRDVFQHIYPLSFDAADLICIRKPPLLEKIPLEKRFSSPKLVKDLKHRGKNACYFPDTDQIIDFLVKEAKPGDLILIMSNGSFDHIHDRLLKRL
ncbi:MAG TPA: UDP-N-acetylmuramate:L-alanyl-gamma-D-glutamyl-meso-diaminopimelate ligase [Desulfobacterales bacterium]|nr:UDP-N-acetylmuramate:L-alanyl-gamma-D-glutamyl-meso-diaminopimelate ligase [Desulfobacterales bacterium]